MSDCTRSLCNVTFTRFAEDCARKNLKCSVYSGLASRKLTGNTPSTTVAAGVHMCLLAGLRLACHDDIANIRCYPWSNYVLRCTGYTPASAPSTLCMVNVANASCRSMVQVQLHVCRWVRYNYINRPSPRHDVNQRGVDRIALCHVMHPACTCLHKKPTSCEHH